MNMFYLPFVVFCCFGMISSQMISMPLKDDMQATLKADLDVNEMNKYLQTYIQQEIKKGVDATLTPLVEKVVQNHTSKAELRLTEKLEEKHTDILQEVKSTEKTLTSLVENMVQNQTKAELRLTEKLEEKHTDILHDGKTLTALLENMFQNQRKTELRSTEKLEERQNYAFYATLTTDKTDMAIGTVIIFDLVSLNVGSAYSVTTGKFTCKVDGIYVFSWTTMSFPDKDSSTTLVVNGNKKAGNIVDSDLTKDHLSSSSKVIVNLHKGDSVWIEVYDITSNVRARWADQPCSMFSGFKIN